ncbi:hypothetical protein D041_4880 [Vibrio parahaemolyticus EKP-008]|nr:hypothetical protein D041_4880 [Vibrio parahaemolyticus EKP-008]
MEDEVSRTLLQSAIILRILDDESEADKDEKNPFYCGELSSKNGVQKLSLREACNKIIHGQKINFDIEELGGCLSCIYMVPKEKMAGKPNSISESLLTMVQGFSLLVHCMNT